MKPWKTKIMKQSKGTINTLEKEHKKQLTLLQNENKILQNNIEHNIVKGCRKNKMELYNELLNEITTLQQSTETRLESDMMSIIIKQIEELHHKHILETPLSSLQVHENFLLNEVTDMATKNHKHIEYTILQNVKDTTIPKALNSIKS